MAVDRTRRIRKALLSDFALDNWHTHRVDREAFTIYVGSDPHLEGDWEGSPGEAGVEHHMADRFDLNLHVLSALDPKHPIKVMLASCGGLWEAGLQMAGAMLTCSNPITVIGTKHCRSMTSMIPLFADRFYLRPPAQYMIHHGTMVYEGDAGASWSTAVQEQADARDRMLRLYQARLKEQGRHSRKGSAGMRVMLEEMMDKKADVFFTTDEAVDWGFADGVWLGASTPLASKPNTRRRDAMMEVLRAPRNVNVKGSLLP